MQFRLITGTVWLIFGVAMFGIYAAGQPIANFPPVVTLILGVIASALGFFRLWTAWEISKRRRLKPPPVRRRPVPGASLEYNPEFDFNRPGPQTIPSDDGDGPKS